MHRPMLYHEWAVLSNNSTEIMQWSKQSVDELKFYVRERGRENEKKNEN